MSKKLALVWAMTDERVIGKGNELPWRLPEDLKHFRAVTTGHAILMGRLTHQSIGRALPGRRNIIVTSRPELVAEGCEVAPSLEAALAMAYESDDEPRIIGGARLYADALPAATKLFLTEVHRKIEGDVFFPELDRGAWRELERRAGETPDVEFVVLERISSTAAA